ncbi:NADH-dependent flavin oxidoreductase [Halalkalibacter nanhaiisediminis]|uniref:2,4-dienoyl-CoA reductase-like NADH-dependent reductase (Old Yellow Enzyme family) n=1 Tax=Halalkalibacter nanhaiisediminis TaxID=688079 RepID=A0A562QMN2_9BACI|nr:NADH-dependent flavin oxidoreductase [Halalkalibacter nanhaiisediminis]TWI57999.1 2,4-dienoyl-CoA reductase-like NADH-dependent reductase (Old Yellow Enzyme family) [Halalkalibacter nanhaiisediminis]
MNPNYKELFEPLTFRSGVTLKNRVLMAPMTNFSSNEDGSVSDAELAYYQERAGGVGAVVTACVYVTKDGKGFPGEFGADDDSLIPSLTRLASAIKEKGAKAILQIFHGGRMSPPDQLPDGQTISASAVAAERPDAQVPREMTEDDITRVITAFGDATRRAIEAGFDGVEIHGANTYLIQQFFSPHSNRRTDKWGGTLEKRLSFPTAIVEEVFKNVKAHTTEPFIVGYRFSPEEGENPGITFEDTLALADKLATYPLDYLHVSVQNFWSGSIRDKEDTTSRVVRIQEHIGDQIPVIGVGSLHTPDDVVKAMQTGVPLIAIGRELIMEPKWVEKVQEGKEDTIPTTLSKQDQEKLVVPTPLWQAIINTPGWFPVED